jgi:DNA-binding LacI/PurR family transcriptional regulator
MQLTSLKDKFNAIYHYLKGLENFTGIFCANNEMALLVYYVLKKYFLHMLGTIQLVTFDEIYLPEFSYILQDTKTICKQAVESLMKQIDGLTTVESIVVPCKFVPCFEENFN